jgi:glutamine synthetase adenylyltransferase
VVEETQEEPLQRIVEADWPEDADDDGEYLAEVQEFEEEAEALRLEDRRELLKDRKQDRRERKRYAELVFRLVCWWLAGVMALVCCSGLDALHIDGDVLMTIVGSTTASVVAIFVLVAKYLFPPRS